MKEKCSNDSHRWVCVTTSGQSDEIKKMTKLSSDQVNQVLKDNGRSEEFCPAGVIVCQRCETPLISGQSMKPQLDFDELTRRLVN